ncbi:glycosyltransferase family 4 protein [Roseicella frigidaeris]|uniref:glycosyltransferase family 4 protein n=1 Tax=Roseicella frigidaeris TaxID=2230885 RepID=UPI00140253C4|nr:glycosyltransferase family 4 protein [Roseicella frigidaeris]
MVPPIAPAAILANPALVRQPGRRRRILFVQLGPFSHTNAALQAQLARRFPNHDLTVFDVKDEIRRRYDQIAANLLISVATYGPSILRSQADRHAFFFRTPYLFRKLSRIVQERFAAEADSFDFVFQTQGLCNAALPGRPLFVYTDHTILSNREYAAQDDRIFLSDAFLALERDLYHRAEKILVSVSHVRRTLTRGYGCDPNRVATVFIGANVAPTPAAPEAGRQAGRILFVGIEWERKGGPTLLTAFERLAERFPEAQLTIAGCAPATTHPRIQTLGRVPPQQLAPHFAAASVFCMPSLVEPAGIAAIEAMAAGLPVVATAVGGLAEIVQPDQTGLLVPPNDPLALGEALASLLADPDRARAMGQAGRHRAMDLFHWDAVGTRLAQEIRQSLNARARAGRGDAADPEQDFALAARHAKG